jgi:uncharacterized membrane protein YecN with MAPEG domain
VSEVSAARSTGSEDQRVLRCRVGLHRWVQVKYQDADLENPGAEAVWLTRCRYCGVERGSGIPFAMAMVGVAATAGALLWWLVSPVLGVLLVTGALLGLLGVARTFALSRPGRFGFRYRG